MSTQSACRGIWQMECCACMLHTHTFPIGGLTTSLASAAANVSVLWICGLCVGAAVSINCCCCCCISPSIWLACCTGTCSRTYCMLCGSIFSCCSISAIWPPANCTTCRYNGMSISFRSVREITLYTCYSIITDRVICRRPLFKIFNATSFTYVNKFPTHRHLVCTVLEVDLHVVRYTRCKIFHRLALKTYTMNRLKYH